MEGFKKVKIKIKVVAPTTPASSSVTYSEEMLQYMSQLNVLQRKTFEIAREHLGTSFNPYLSNGFKEWKEKQG